ncbi:MAG: EAL domain-containing protein [Devosia sp.]
MSDRAAPKLSTHSSLRLLVVVWPFVAIILTQALVASFSVQMVSSLRAYVTGESLWSKGQHDAVYYLGRYISTGDRNFLEHFDGAMEYPLGDREARLALEADPPDLMRATAGFIQGGNYPSDVPGMIWLFRNFHWLSYMGQAIDDWRLAETALLRLEAFAADVDTHLPAVSHEAEMARLDALNDQITPLTSKFAVSLGEGARFVQSALLYANIAIGALFIVVTFLRLNHFVRHRRRIEGELSWHAAHDYLTGLPNRRSFEQSLQVMMADPRSRLTLMFLDIDQFKLVNDSGGHAAGDELLRQVATFVPKYLRPSDVLARLGGDEFGLILADCSPDNGLALAQRIQEAFEQIDFVWQGQHHAVSASIGLVQLEGSRLSVAEALRAADLACYIAKEKGRNRVYVHAPDNVAEAEMSTDMGWVQRLHRALEEDRFELYAQPIIPTIASNGDGEHVELLLRLREGNNGELIPPGAFIPAAERFGVMPAIDRWVVKAALKTIAARGRLADRSTYSINLSGATLNDDLFEGFLCDALASSGVAPELLCFEITETSAVANLDRAAAFMETMRLVGCRFALDDFGVGMSSLTYLKRFPVDYLKIDGSFVRDMLTDKYDRATIEMINHLAHVAGKKTIAEFVATPAILAALTEIGVDYLQGYAIARPAPFLADTQQMAPGKRLRA